MKTSVDCACAGAEARFQQFDTHHLGRDQTEGRFADVTLHRCKVCNRLWLRYFVEYEAFSKSGRWARGLIDEETANSMTPEAAVDHLNSLDWYLYGGSRFGGRSGLTRGPTYWGP